MGVGGLELAKTKQNKQKMASFSREKFLIEQSLILHCLTLTYDPILVKVKVDPHVKGESQGQTVQTGMHTQADRQTDSHQTDATIKRTHRRYQTHYLPATQ